MSTVYDINNKMNTKWLYGIYLRNRFKNETQGNKNYASVNFEKTIKMKFVKEIMLAYKFVRKAN